MGAAAMAGSAPARIAFIGFGEVGQTFSRGFAANGVAGIRAYDLLFGHASDGRLEAAAHRIGVSCAETPEQACADASFIFSAVTADRAEAGVGHEDDPVRGQALREVDAVAVRGDRRAGSADQLHPADLRLGRRPGDAPDQLVERGRRAAEHGGGHRGRHRHLVGPLGRAHVVDRLPGGRRQRRSAAQLAQLVVDLPV